MRKFGDLSPPHPAPPHLKAEREIVARLTSELDSEAILLAILSAMQTAFDAGEPLPSAEQLRTAVPELAAGLSSLQEALPYNDGSATGVLQRLVTGAVARFLAAAPTELKRVPAVTELEHDVDWTYLLECFAGELKAPNKWVALTLGRTLILEAKGSGDDRDLLQSEVAKWRTAREKQVPQWRRGNLIPMGIRHFLLMGGLLRAVDETAWLRFLDKQELASVIETLLWQEQLDQAPASILRLIGESDVAFDSNGNRTESVAVYFITEKALELIEDDLDGRVRRDATVEDAKAELAAQDGLLQELVDTLAARSDSEILLTELGANYLLRAQTATPEFGRMKTKFEIYQHLATTIHARLGSAETVVTLARARAVQSRESQWGLWLLAADSSYSAKARSRGNELTGIRQELWTWLTALMVSGDSSLIDRYSDFPDWVVQLAGFNLAKVSAPATELERTWGALTAQRMERVENRYAKDTWRTSKLVCRSGFLAARVGASTDVSLAAQMWSLSMKMAISSWLSSPNGDAISEVAYGLCHLAAGPISVSGEPARTLAYLRGEPSLLAQAVVALRRNGLAARDILEAAGDAGVDVVCHLELVSNREQIEDFEDELEHFRKAANPNGAIPATMS